ncbi:MAG: hypothetical protein J5I50_07945 [Chitinophagaceae bacterium]|nr:hypothetical protein [Chitinophagaceae bacterium]
MYFSKNNFFRLGLLVSLSCLLVLFGCSKKRDNGGSDYYFKFTVGTQSYTYTAYSYANFSTSGDIHMVGIGGFEDMGVGTKNVASVLVGSLDEIAKGSYSGLVYPGSSGNTPKVFFTWIDNEGKTFGNYYDDNATNTVILTQVSSSAVKGTFSGKIYDVASLGTNARSFSGEFYVKRVN